MFTKETFQTNDGWGFKIFKNGSLYATQTTRPTREGIKPIPDLETAAVLATEMVEFLTHIEER